MKLFRCILILSFFLFYNCKKNGNEREIINKADTKIKSGKIQTSGNKSDTIILDFNLTMEWAVRKDSIVLIKNEDSISIRGIVKQKIEGLDKDFLITYLKPRNYSSKKDLSNLELLIKKYSDKKNKGDAYLLKAYKNNDTLILYSDNLTDKNNFIQEYFKIMRKIYPDSKVYNEL